MLQQHLEESDSSCFEKKRFVCQNTVAWEEKIRIFVFLTTTAVLKKKVIIKIVKYGMVITQLVI